MHTGFVIKKIVLYILRRNMIKKSNCSMVYMCTCVREENIVSSNYTDSNITLRQTHMHL